MKYYIYRNKTKEGPFTLEELSKMELTKDTYVWRNGFDNWKVITEVEELEDLVESTPPPVPIEDVLGVKVVEPIQIEIKKTKKEHDYSKGFAAIRKFIAKELAKAFKIIISLIGCYIAVLILLLIYMNSCPKIDPEGIIQYNSIMEQRKQIMQRALVVCKSEYMSEKSYYIDPLTFRKRELSKTEEAPDYSSRVNELLKKNNEGFRIYSQRDLNNPYARIEYLIDDTDIANKYLNQERIYNWAEISYKIFRFVNFSTPSYCPIFRGGDLDMFKQDYQSTFARCMILTFIIIFFIIEVYRLLRGFISWVIRNSND
jgi:hypothetical protein